MYHRIINILQTRSFFLFGARGTGKSTVLAQIFPKKETVWIDLLASSDFLRYSRQPGLLFQQATSLAAELKEQTGWIVVDEVQRVPKLLNEVHRVLEDQDIGKKICFALTGSSARKLKRGGANLLGGRALVNNLYPLSFVELKDDFSLGCVLNWGSLPAITTEQDELTRAEMLESYVTTYLREEISEEQVVRQLDPFIRFLEVAAQTSGQIVNYAGIARDCQVDPKSVSRYFQILEDTLLGVFIPSYHRSVRKQQSKSPKFYIFDLGVQRALQGMLTVPVVARTHRYGRLFEQLVVLEIYRLNKYLRKRYKLFYLRTKDNAEIDLIVERPGLCTILIEIKSSEIAQENDARHLRAFLPEFKDSKAWLVSQDTTERTENGVKMMHWSSAIRELFELTV